MTRKTLLIGTALALGLGALGLQANAWGARGDGAMMGMGGEMRPDFATLDANSDGKITPEEITAYRTARVTGMDADGDGKITEAELTAFIEANLAARAADMAKARIAAQDSDGDGTLTLDEAMTGPGDMGARLFERADTDGDGAISQEEFDAVLARMGKGRDGHGHGQGGHGGMGGGKGMMGNGPAAN